MAMKIYKNKSIYFKGFNIILIYKTHASITKLTTLKKNRDYKNHISYFCKILKILYSKKTKYKSNETHAQ